MAAKTEENLPAKRKSKFFTWVLNHKMVSFLLILILVIFFWSFIKSGIRERQFKDEKQRLVNTYDSIAVNNMENTAKVFSWAIRSEMMRDNMEQVNQYLSNFIKGPDVSKVLLINPSDQKIILSTDKKDEGTSVSDTSILQAQTVMHVTNESGTKIISPVMGLNSKLAVLVIELKKRNVEK